MRGLSLVECWLGIGAAVPPAPPRARTLTTSAEKCWRDLCINAGDGPLGLCRSCHGELSR